MSGEGVQFYGGKLCSFKAEKTVSECCGVRATIKGYEESTVAAHERIPNRSISGQAPNRSISGQAPNRSISGQAGTSLLKGCGGRIPGGPSL